MRLLIGMQFDFRWGASDVLGRTSIDLLCVLDNKYSVSWRRENTGLLGRLRVGNIGRNEHRNHTDYSRRPFPFKLETPPATASSYPSKSRRDSRHFSATDVCAAQTRINGCDLGLSSARFGYMRSVRDTDDWC